MFIIEGHCDERGSIEYNLALGENRANAAKQALVQQGVSATRMRTISYGKEKTILHREHGSLLATEPPRPLRVLEVTHASTVSDPGAALVPIVRRLRSFRGAVTSTLKARRRQTLGHTISRHLGIIHLCDFEINYPGWPSSAVLFATVHPAFAVSKEIIQLQTQVQTLSDQVARLQQSIDERMGVHAQPGRAERRQRQQDERRGQRLQQKVPSRVD